MSARPIEADLGTVLAVDFGGTKVALAAFDTQGVCLGQRSIAVLAELGAEQVVDRTLDEVQQLLAEVEARRGLRLRAAGVVSPGIVRPDRVLLAPNVPGWSELRLAERFERRLRVPVQCATDTKAAASAEATWGHLVGVDPGVHLNLGTGIAAGIVIGGQVLAGASGAAGEFGYNLCTPQDACGPHRGLAPLEQRVGGRGLGQAGTAYGGSGDAQSLLQLARDPAAPAHHFTVAALHELAMHVVNLAILVDPARITVGGGLTGAADLILPILGDFLRRAVPFPPDLRLARFPNHGPLIGAAALAFRCLGLECGRIDPFDLRRAVEPQAREGYASGIECKKSSGTPSA